MKGLARSFVYWPKIDTDIENMANSCESCARNSQNPPKDHHWQYPNGPWERIHVDYAGPVAGTMLLIVSDAYSKWLEVKPTNSTTSSATIAILDELFAAYGAPITLVSDNGTNFTSKEFKDFLDKVGVQFHKLTAPYHPATNGQAERSVQTIKNALRAMNTTKPSIHTDINEFLRQYRRAPHTTTGLPPAQLFLGRLPRSRLDLVFPWNIPQKITEKQFIKTTQNFRSFVPEQNVCFPSNNSRMEKWLKGHVNRKLGDLHYEIEFQGKMCKRHTDQIKNRTLEERVEGSRELHTPCSPQHNYKVKFFPKDKAHKRYTEMRLQSSTYQLPQTPNTDKNTPIAPTVIHTSTTVTNHPTPAVNNHTISPQRNLETLPQASDCTTPSQSNNYTSPLLMNVRTSPPPPPAPGKTLTSPLCPPLRKSTRIRKKRLIYSP